MITAALIVSLVLNVLQWVKWKQDRKRETGNRGTGDDPYLRPRLTKFDEAMKRHRLGR